MFNKLLTYLSNEHCPVVNLFIDWNPIYTDQFKAGDALLATEQELYKPQGEEEPSPWARL